MPPLPGATHTQPTLATNVGSSLLLIRTKNTKEVHAVIPTTHPKIQSAAILIVTASHSELGSAADPSLYRLLVLVCSGGFSGSITASVRYQPVQPRVPFYII